MKIKEKSNLKLIIIIASIGFLFGCGLSSKSSSDSSGGGSPSSVSVKSISPGEMAKLQNQQIAKLTPREFDEDISKMEGSDAIKTLYYGLSNKNPAIRKKSAEDLTMLLKDDDQFLDELKKLETENIEPDSWFSASQIISDVEKMKSRVKEAELKHMMEQ
jgi:hypothetical protein